MKITVHSLYVDTADTPSEITVHHTESDLRAAIIKHVRAYDRGECEALAVKLETADGIDTPQWQDHWALFESGLRNSDTIQWKAHELTLTLTLTLR